MRLSRACAPAFTYRAACSAPGVSAVPENSPLPCSRRRLRWELGCPACDDLLPRGLEANSLHEIKGVPSAIHGASAADWMAGIGFAARLAVQPARYICDDPRNQWVFFDGWFRDWALGAVVLAASACGRIRFSVGGWPCEPRSRSIAPHHRRDGACGRRVECDRRESPGSEPRRRHRHCRGGGVDTGAPLEPCVWRDGNALPSRHASRFRARRGNGNPMAR